LNSVSSLWATPPALLFLWTICLGWLPTTILLISAFWVARITGGSDWCPAKEHSWSSEQSHNSKVLESFQVTKQSLCKPEVIPKADPCLLFSEICHFSSKYPNLWSFHLAFTHSTAIYCIPTLCQHWTASSSKALKSVLALNLAIQRAGSVH
jgi:hypothetical protein